MASASNFYQKLKSVLLGVQKRILMGGDSTARFNLASIGGGEYLFKKIRNNVEMSKMERMTR
jgi:hypothetical protein